MNRVAMTCVRSLSFLGSLSFALAVAPVLLAQEPAAPPQYYLLHSEVAKPSRVAAYEAATREFLAAVTAHREKLPSFHFSALMGTDLTYTYAMPISGYAALDTINAEFGAFVQALGADKYAELNRLGGDATEYWRESVVRLAPELSYQPESPRLKTEEMQYFHFSIYYLLGGREKEAEEVAKDFLSLFRAKKIADGYRIFWLALGPEMPALIVQQAGKDAADFYAQVAKNDVLLSGEQMPLVTRALALTRRFETREAWLRPDLSLPPFKP